MGERFKKAKNLVYIHASINYHPTWDIRSIHKEKNPFACKHCEKKFGSLGGLKSHERIHTGEKPYTCTHCEKTFTDAGNLKVHDF